VSERRAIDSLVTLDDLRARFWWLGPGKGSYIVSLDADVVTIKVIQSSWNRRTQLYEEAVARDFAALGLRVTWQPIWSEALAKEIHAAREQAEKKKELFDEETFIARMRAGEK
jgi:hypothetical protein